MKPNQTDEESSHSFCVGDVVTWTHTKSSGNSFSFSTRKGKIESVRSLSAYVKMRNGRIVVVLLSDLRKEGEQTELTEMFANTASPQGEPDKRKPHQERVIKEKEELDERLAKLNEFGNGDIFPTLPAEERERLERQSKIMDQYSIVLGERIAAFSD